jgi:phosphoadenosine phosphosulfate reductase
VNELALAVLAEPAADRTDLPPAERLDRALGNASPAEVIAAALRTVGREHLAVVSSFGTESAALLKVAADVDPAIPVIFLDTGWLFEETLAYRDTLIATLGLRDVRSIKPLEDTLSREDQDRELWFSDPMPAAGSGRSSP